MDRVFLDANVLFSAAYQPLNPLLNLWQLPGVELLSSPLAILEAETALGKKRPGRLADLATLLPKITLVPDPPVGQTLPSAISLPTKDGPIFLSAVNSHASHFLTGDIRHFGPYLNQTIAGVLILRPSVYLQAKPIGP